MNDKPEGIPVEELFPGLQTEEVTAPEVALVTLQQGYREEQAKAVQNRGLVQAEVNRLTEVILRLEGCIVAIDNALPLVANALKKQNSALAAEAKPLRLAEPEEKKEEQKDAV